MVREVTVDGVRLSGYSVSAHDVLDEVIFELKTGDRTHKFLGTEEEIGRLGKAISEASDQEVGGIVVTSTKAQRSVLIEGSSQQLRSIATSILVACDFVETMKEEF